MSDNKSCLAQDAFELSQTHGIHCALDAFHGLGEAELRLLDYEANSEEFNDTWDFKLLQLERQRKSWLDALEDTELPGYIKAGYERRLVRSEGYLHFLEYLKTQREVAALEISGISVDEPDVDDAPERNSDVDNANTIHWTGLISHLERFHKRYTLTQATELNAIVKAARCLRMNERGIGWYHYTKLRMMLEYIIARKSRNKFALENYRKFKGLFIEARKRSYEYARVSVEDTYVSPREFGDEPAGHDACTYVKRLPLKHVSDARRRYVMSKVDGDKQKAAEWLGIHIDML